MNAESLKTLRHGLSVFGGIVALGFSAIALTWLGASRDTLVPAQSPWLVSGGLAGLGLIGLGAVCAPPFVRRHNDAIELRSLDRAADDARHIAVLLGERRTIR